MIEFLKAGDFVEPTGFEFEDKEKPVGLIFDFEERGMDGYSARVLWLNSTAYSIHWDVGSLRQVQEPYDVDWKMVASKIAEWFTFYYNG